MLAIEVYRKTAGGEFLSGSTDPSKANNSDPIVDDYAQYRVVLLSGSLRLSGSTTWILALQGALRQIACPVIHIAVGEPSEVGVPDDYTVLYTGRARRHWLLRLSRILQLHKLLPEWFDSKSDQVTGRRIQAILRRRGWQDRLDLVIKDFTGDTPGCLKAWPLVSVIHQNLSPDRGSPARSNPARRVPAPRSETDPALILAAVSRAVAEDARGVGLDVSCILYNPLDVERLRRLAAADHPHGDYLLFAGSLHRDKGVYQLLEAFARAGLSQQLWYVGAGKELQGLQSRARSLGIDDRVVFLGYRDNPYPYIAQARLLVLPSRREAMGYVCLEAAALGTPFLVSDYPAAAEFFDPGVQIALDPEGDFVERLSQRLRESLESPVEPGVLDGVFERLAPGAVARSYLALISQ